MTLKKPIAGLLLLASAAGGPYVLFETEAGNQARSGAASLIGTGGEEQQSGWLTSASDTAATFGYWNANGVDPAPMPSVQASPDGQGPESMRPPITSLGEVLRFDITPSWVPTRFSRVSTVLAETHLDGLRVPLVTGTSPADLAGTLTYYFDRYKRLQRINVHAVTGNPARFIAELQHAHRFQQQPSLGGYLYLLRWNGQPTSIIYATPAPVIEADSPYGRYNLFIELNQSGLQYGLSSEAHNLLAAGQQTARWQ